MCQIEKDEIHKKRALTTGSGFTLCAVIVVLRLCSGLVGGAFQAFYEAAFPWLITGLCVAMVLEQDRKDGE